MLTILHRYSQFTPHLLVYKTFFETIQNRLLLFVTYLRFVHSVGGIFTQNIVLNVIFKDRCRSASFKRSCICTNQTAAMRPGVKRADAKSFYYNFVCFPSTTRFLLLQLDYRWAIVACGRTQDQLDMTEKAHKFLKTTGLKPRSLNFWNTSFRPSLPFVHSAACPSYRVNTENCHH